MLENHMRGVAPYLTRGLLDLISELPNNISMIEIGCYAGESTKMFLESGKISKLYAIDPYFENYDPLDPYAMAYKMSDVKQSFIENVVNKYSQVEFLNVTSEEAMNKFQEKSLDFIYIDANHQYEFVKKDLEFKKFIKDGGIIAGHDYISHAGVKRAVDEVLGIPHSVYADWSWLVKL